jgi:hypothetical protein
MVAEAAPVRMRAKVRMMVVVSVTAPRSRRYA